jgi:hypothetical protein
MIDISSFDELKRIKNSIIFCDIDETILKFEGINPEWWRNKFNEYYSLSHDYEQSELKALNEWIYYITHNENKLTHTCR